MRPIETITSDIYKNIQSEPSIKDPTHISVSYRKDGFWFFGKKKILIKGRVETNREKEKIESIASAYAGGVPIIDELRVSGNK